GTGRVEQLGAGNPDSSGQRSRTVDDPLLRRSADDARRNEIWYSRRVRRSGYASRKKWASRGGGYAASRYSRISPPSRSCRRTRPRSMTLPVASSLASGEVQE